jgi:hypothetical protein
MEGRCTNLTVIATPLDVTELVAKAAGWHGSPKIVFAKEGQI